MKDLRGAALGGLVASFGFFFLPLIELKPNRITSGISFQLLQLEGDLRFVTLFLLALAPLVVALRPADGIRGWLLSGLGNGLLFLTFFLPAVAGERLLSTAGAVALQP